MSTDAKLVQSAQSGDEKAFETLVKKHRPRINATISDFINNAQDREDIAQETFINAYRNLHQLSNPDRFSYWLIKIAQNQCRDWIRKNRDHTIPVDEVDENLLNAADSPERESIESEQRQIIAQTIQALPETERQIAHAHYLEGTSHQELVNHHGLSYQSVCVRLSRAKQKLAKRLQHLLTGVFVSPTTILKQIYSGGLTVMKVGTVPKITVGVAALVALIFIGVRQMNAPTVKERVYLSPWKDGTERPRNSSEGLADQTKSTQDTELRDNQAQSSAAEIEPNDDFFSQPFFSQPEETDTMQFATEAEFEIEADQSFTTDTSTLLDDKGQSPEDVMNAYLKALRSLDGEGIRSLMTGTAKEEFESEMLPVLNGELPQDLVDIYYSVSRNMLPEEEADQMADELIQTAKEGMLPILKQMFGQAEVVSSEHVGDKFHFRIRITIPKIPGASELGIPEMPKIPDSLHKIRKENGVWRIYDSP